MIRVPIGQGRRPALILGRYANRHGLITGATGTGKTYTLATLAEGFSRAGVPVFMADVKGDLAGLETGPAPVAFLDVYGAEGAQLRVPVRRFGADLMARVLSLSPVQTDVLAAIYATSSARLDTLADLSAALAQVESSAHRPPGRQSVKAAQSVGLAGAATVGAIERALIKFRQTGADSFFGSPGFDIAALEQRTDGAGLITILAADRLVRFPALYAAVLLWFLGELYERAPEVGDLEAPRLVLFFDEAHLLFQDAPPALIRRLEQTVRLIRSKGVGVYFASQSPADIPAAVAAQLGNRIQHAMRAATLADRREIRGAAECLPINPKLDAGELIATMRTGQALVSTIDETGAPRPVDLVTVARPVATLGPRVRPAALQSALNDLATLRRFEAVRDDPPSRVLDLVEPKRPRRWRVRFWLVIAALVAGAVGAPAWLVLIALAAAVTVPLG